MKARSLKTGQVELKLGDKVAVYRTDPYKAPISTKLGATILSYSTASALTYLFGYGFVSRVYKHIRACVVQLRVRRSEKPLFIKEDDPQWSVYIEEEK